MIHKISLSPLHNYLKVMTVFCPFLKMCKMDVSCFANKLFKYNTWSNVKFNHEEVANNCDDLYFMYVRHIFSLLKKNNNFSKQITTTFVSNLYYDVKSILGICRHPPSL